MTARRQLDFFFFSIFFRFESAGTEAEMTTIEQLFKRIFDRKCRIEAQLRQQKESYAESLAYSLLADGKQPPPWLLESQNELSSKHFAPGISFPLPTPSAHEVCISKEYTRKEHTDVATITSHQKDDQRDCDIICSEVVEDSSVSGSVVSIQCGWSKQKDTEENLYGTKQIASFGDEVTVEGNTRRITRSMATISMSGHTIEPSFTRNSLSLHSKVGDKAASSEAPVECNPRRIIRSKQKEPDEYLNGTKQIANFGDEVTIEGNARRITSKVGDKAASSGSPLEHNPRRITRSLAASLISDHAPELSVARNSFALQSKAAHEASPSRSLDCPGNMLQLLSSLEYLSANPHDPEGKIHSRSCETSHDLATISCGMACTNDSDLKQFVRSSMDIIEDNYKTMVEDKSACNLNLAPHDLQIDNSVLLGGDACLESEETEFAAHNVCCSTVANPILIVHDVGKGGRLTATSDSTRPASGVPSLNHSSEPRYSLRSLSRDGKVLSYSDPDGSSNITSSKSSRNLAAKACEISWPKKRKLNCYSDSILATTPRIRLHQRMLAHEGNCYSTKRSLDSASFEEIQKTTSPVGSTLNYEGVKAVSGSHLEEFHQRQNQCEREPCQVNSCSKSTDQLTDTCLPNQSTNVFPSLNLADESRTFISNGICNSGAPICILEGSGPPGNDAHDGLDSSATIVDFSDLQAIEKREICPLEKDLQTYSSVRDDLVNNNEFVPEFEGFSIGISPTLGNDAYSNSGFPPLSLNIQTSSLTSLVTPTNSPLGYSKINKIPDVFQSLPNGLLGNMNLNDPLYLHNDYGKLFRTNEHAQASLHSSLESVFDFSCMDSSYSHNASSSCDTFDGASSKPPLTPPIGSSCLRRVSGKSGSGSQTLVTNPELVCFRIDEDSTTLDDNEHSDELGISDKGTCLKEIKALDDREPLRDISSIYRNTQNSCPLIKVIPGNRSHQSLDTKFSYGTEINVHSSLGSSYSNNTDQMGDIENQCFPVNGDKDRSIAKSLSNRSSEPELNTKKLGRNRSQASIQKGYKPNNIVSNVSSFIPMIKKQQQATTTKGKKEIKVKALEAAEAAKRLEEKRQIEREIRKAAAKLERERLEQKKQLKLKQMEEKRRKEAERLEHEKQLKQNQLEDKRRKETEIAARKRQQEEEDWKERERKRRCNEDTRKLQREQEERLRTKKEEKELRFKALVDDGKKKGLMQDPKQPLKLKEISGSTKTNEVDPISTKVTTSSNITKGIIQDRLSTNKKNQDCESYEISPYKDSDDDEDGADENLRRRKKYIPSWARDPLEKLLLRQQDTNPFDIFFRKNSFSLNQVLCPPVTRRWPL
ncbi:uncharacterized protein LOC121971948 isoform X3 [Zingiber officinale]|uniref:uncharacterized protein LOC121971948 isoform X3 n=1 Tax=Zingiber officinale TaxID=94328 RepID=UPI001C4CD638|nr:uncharacterized protein LOC121971948 isoform X3 [Zingiber officinale]